MPGNEVGDRVHNFFGQENLSQGQYHSQAVDGNWPGLSNNLWIGSQRSAGAPFISNLKNFNVQQSDSEPGYTSASHMQHGLNLTQSNLRPESGRSQSQNQQTAVNGYVQGHQVFNTKQNEGNILGMDTGSDWHGLSSRIPVLDSQGSGLELYKKNMARSEAAESPVNFDFFGGQQQISGRHPGMLQPLTRQQLGINDMQLLQQQAMLSQMQEYQRQHQFHQLEARQQSSMNPASSISKQNVGNHSASLINGIPINEASNLVWQSEVMATNPSWLQRGVSPVMQGSSNGLMFSPEQGQALRLMGLAPNQSDQSLYGLPVSNSRGTSNLYSHAQVDKPVMSHVSIPHQYSHVQGDKPAMLHVSAGSNAFPSHQYAEFSEQTNTKDGNSISRHDIQGKSGNSISRHDIQEKSMFASAVQGISSGVMENLQQLNSEQRKVSTQELHGRQEIAGSSQTSQDKVVVQVSPSQNVATLDPTEEKILFGSDDSLWDSFGRNTGGFNMLDGTDSLSGFPSMQSGSWSALMQSAVAETSSSEVGIQEEWSGLNFRNTEHSPVNERPSTTDSSKQHSVWAENNLQSTSNLNSGGFLQPADISRSNTTMNYSAVSGFHQLGLDTSHGQDDRLQTDSTHRSIPQSLERGKWLDSSPQQKKLREGSHIFHNASNSSALANNDKAISGSWSHQRTLSSCNSSGDLFNKPNGWNPMKSVPPDSNASVKNCENENSLQLRDEKAIHEMDQLPGIWGPDSDTNLSAGLECVKSAAGNMQSCGEESNMNGIAAVPNLGTTWVNRQSNRQLPSSLNVDVWRDADSLGNYRGIDNQGKPLHHMEKNPLVLESSTNEKGTCEMLEMESSNKEDRSACVGSNASYLKAGGLRENFCSDTNDPRSPKSFGQISRRLVTRKFQYHPMGVQDVDLEPSHGNKQVISSLPMTPQSFGGLKAQEQSYFAESKVGHTDRDNTEFEKGDSEGLDNNTSKSIFPGHIPKKLTSFDRSGGNYPSNKTDSSRVPETEPSEGSVVHPQFNQSSFSQGFGLQLAPPSQRASMESPHGSSDTVLTTPHVASETGDKGFPWLNNTQIMSSQGFAHRESRNNVSGTPGQFFDKALQYNVLGNISQSFTSGFPFSRIHTQNQNVASLGGQIAATQCSNVALADRTSSMNQIDEYCHGAQTNQSELESANEMPQLNHTDQIRPRDIAIQNSASQTGTASQPIVAFSASQNSAPSKELQNMWTSVSGKQDSLGGRPPKVASFPQANNNFEMITGPQKPGDKGSEKDGDDLSGVDPGCVHPNGSGRREQLLKESSGQQILPDSANSAEETISASHGREAVGKSIPDISHLSPAATSSDIEAFGRSLRANNIMHQNFSLLQQVQSMKNTEIDPSNRDLKRFKGSDNVLDSNNRPQLPYGYYSMVRNASGNQSPLLSSDPKMLNLSTKSGDGQDTSVSSQDILGYSQKNALNMSNAKNATSLGADHSLISPQMAPSWFEQYGSFKNGKIMPEYDTQKMTPPKIVDQSFNVQNQSDRLQVCNSMELINRDTSQPGNTQQIHTPASVESEQVPSQLLPPPAIEPNLASMRPNKRKNATSELVPWHKELTPVSERLQNISVAELDWAQAANRLIEKVEDDTEAIEDLQPMVKSKRRLILTTQLMQQLLSPPPAAILSADVKLHHASVVFTVARLVLGDVCSSVSWSGHDALVSPGSRSQMPEKLNSSERVDQYLLKVMEALGGRAKKLESDILRLDSRASILDLRVECQDLERFSVINRFAKFHGRAQNDGAETSSSSDATSNAHKSCPQRYVTAVPMPKNLPDRVQCLSL